MQTPGANRVVTGSFNEEGLEYAMKEFKAAVGGTGGKGGEGWCVLMDGDNAIHSAQQEKQEKL